MPNPDNNLSRRSFVKRTSFTAASIIILSQGIALSVPEGGSSGSGNPSGSPTCPAKTTKSITNKTQKLTRTDSCVKYKKKENPSAGIEFWTITPGTPTEDSPSDTPPGDFPEEFTVTVNGKECHYVKEAVAAVTTYLDDPPWAQVGSAIYTPSGPAPTPPTDWSIIDIDNVTFKKARRWESTQSYILQ